MNLHAHKLVTTTIADVDCMTLLNRCLPVHVTWLLQQALAPIFCKVLHDCSCKTPVEPYTVSSGATVVIYVRSTERGT